MFEIDVGKVGKVNIHFANISVKFVSIEVAFSLNLSRFTLTASYKEAYSMKNLVT